MLKYTCISRLAPINTNCWTKLIVKIIFFLFWQGVVGWGRRTFQAWTTWFNCKNKRHGVFFRRVNPVEKQVPTLMHEKRSRPMLWPKETAVHIRVNFKWCTCFFSSILDVHMARLTYIITHLFYCDNGQSSAKTSKIAIFNNCTISNFCTCISQYIEAPCRANVMSGQ